MLFVPLRYLCLLVILRFFVISHVILASFLVSFGIAARLLIYCDCFTYDKTSMIFRRKGDALWTDITKFLMNLKQQING